MKNKSVYLCILVFALIFINGCATAAVPYSFAGDESKTASMTFYSTPRREGLDLHNFEGIELPIPKALKYWSPVIFPAEKPFTLTVNIYSHNHDYGTEKTFNCPALTAGNKYRLEYKRKAGFFGIRREYKLILKDAKTKKIVYEQQL